MTVPTPDAGLAMLGKAVESLDAPYVVVNTPASGVRIFDERLLVLTSLGREPRATWSLAITADRIKDGADDDGLGGVLVRIRLRISCKPC